MTPRKRPFIVAVALLALAAPARADFNRTTLLIDTPTADVLPSGAFAISGIATFPIEQTRMCPGWEAGASLRFSPLDRLEVGVTAYTPKDYVLGVTYQLISGRGRRVGLIDAINGLEPWERKEERLSLKEAQYTSLAVGVYDVGIHKYVSPIGHDSAGAWPDWQYHTADRKYIRPFENFSAFVVTTIPVTGLARVSVGLGRGRFVGYDGINDFLNTDVFFEDHHWWAIGLFGGLEIYITPQVALCAEADSRDANAGLKGSFGPVSVLLALCKVEGIGHTGDEKFGRVACDVSLEIDGLFRPRAAETQQ